MNKIFFTGIMLLAASALWGAPPDGSREKAEKAILQAWGDGAEVAPGDLDVPDSLRVRLEKTCDQCFGQPHVARWRVSRGDSLLGTAMMDGITLRNQHPDVLVLFDPDGAVKSVQVLGFRGAYGRGATTQNWLRHFRGKQADGDFSYAGGVPAVSSATESAHGIRKAVRRLALLNRWLMENN